MPPPPTREVTLQLPSPVDPEADPLITNSGQLMGRYGFEDLGVAIAFDATGAMFADEPPNSQALRLDAIGLRPSFLRPVGLLEDANDRLNPDAPTITFDEWLAVWGDQMGIIDDVETTVGDRAARAITFVPPNGEALDDNGFGLYEPRLLLNDFWPTRIVRVDLDDPNPLFIVIARNDRPDAPERHDWIETTNEWLATIEIGEIAPSPARPWPGATWDTGGLERRIEVDGPCPVSSVALGGVEFEIAEPSWLSAAGDEIWIRDPEQRHVGVEEPVIRIIGPETGWAGSFEDGPTPGDPIITIDDAVAQFERQGWTVDGVDEIRQLLGTSATTVTVAGPDEPSYVFAVGAHAGSDADQLAIAPHRTGRAVIAETGGGVVIAMLDAEVGTDDASILDNRFDRIIDTLQFLSR